MRIETLLKRVSADRIKAVLDAPATFNRKARRQAGLLGRYWKWDSKVIGDPELLPRYVRRHWTTTTLLGPKTRRQRRHKARILKAMKGNLPK